MKTLKLGALAAGAGLLLTGFSASAAIEKNVYSYDTVSTPPGVDSEVVAFQQFNASLGALESVDITIKSYDTAESVVYNFGGTPAVYSGASVTGGSEQVSALGVSTVASALSAGSFSGTAASGVTIAGTGATQEFYSSEIVLSGLSSYIGSGTGTFTLTLDSSAGTAAGTGSSALLFGDAFTSYGTVEIDYNYASIAGSVVSVPEVAHFASFAGGLAVLLLLRRKTGQSRSAQV
jgi:hypothetical protein